MMDGLYYYIPDENELEEVKNILGDHLEIWCREYRANIFHKM